MLTAESAFLKPATYGYSLLIILNLCSLSHLIVLCLGNLPKLHYKLKCCLRLVEYYWCYLGEALKLSFDPVVFSDVRKNCKNGRKNLRLAIFLKFWCDFIVPVFETCIYQDAFGC